MSQSPHHHKHMEDLVAVAGQVEPARPPPLGDPANIEQGPDQIRQRHARLVRQDDVTMGVVPVEHEGMDCRD